MHNRQGQDFMAWHAHIRGACKIIECNGAKHYTSDISAEAPIVSLVEYVRGIDVVRAVSLQEETMFGAEEWDCLRYRQNNRVQQQSLDGLIYSSQLMCCSRYMGNWRT